MAGQSIERRNALRVMALAAAAAASAGEFPGFSRWVFAQDHTAHQKHPAKPQDSVYKPIFFTGAEYALVARLAELIIPNDGTPGASEAGASEFIDFMVANDSRLQPPFRLGLTWMNAHAVRLFGKSFLDLEDEQRNDILKHLAYKSSRRPGEEKGQAFFALIREYTVMGYYTSQIGMEQLGSPGLQQYYAASPACPHTDNREHLNLKPAQPGTLK